MSNLINSGRYTAGIISHTIGETKAGDPQAVITFAFLTGDGPKELTWYGSFKEAAVKYTLQSLVVCGLEGNHPSGKLDIGREVSIVVEVDQDQNGNDRNVIRWVNKLGGNVKEMNPAEAKSKLDQYTGAIMALKETEGVAKPKVKNYAPGAEDEAPWNK